MALQLAEHQKIALEKMHNGCILNGGVGSGKSRTALAYYFIENEGSFDNDGGYVPMGDPPDDLYIITTAAKRYKLEWEQEMVPFQMSKDPDVSRYSNKIVIDSWNNIQKYVNISGAFFIFDEDRVTGSGVWVKTFLKISKRNKWIILSATPGDTWMDYAPVFIANGFYRTFQEFKDNHVIYARFVKYPKIDGYYNVGRLMRLREMVLVPMEFDRPTRPHHEDVFVMYNKEDYRVLMKERWDPSKDAPIETASELCYALRKCVNSDISRGLAVLDIYQKHPKCIIFYNFDYELDIIQSLPYGEDVEIAEWNGHKHQEIPKGNKWVYLVQYTAGAEGWNSIQTNCIIFYSQNYSYKIMAQSSGRIDRMNTKFVDLYYYHLKSYAPIDLAISRAIKQKKKFNETRWVSSK